MIVKILSSASSNFHGVKYNDKKRESGAGELMLMQNFPDGIDEKSKQEEVRNSLLREKMINQYRAEKEEKLKNYNPIDFVKEREEENREFFKLRPREEKVAEKEEIMQEPTKSRMRR